MLTDAIWIGPSSDMGEICPEFIKTFTLTKEASYAALSITVTGVYEAHINGKRIGNFIFAPGCTAYEKRLQYQTYDVTELLKQLNELTITVGKGWYRGHINTACEELRTTPCAVIAQLIIHYTDGTQEIIQSDESWQVRKSPILFSDFYDGELYDASLSPAPVEKVRLLSLSKDTLIPQEGEPVCEQEQIKPQSCFLSPKGERILDFGQNIAGYIRLTVDAARGTKISLSHAEILDADGNFYTENYRKAKAKLTYICQEGKQTYQPHFAFFGFRYLRLDDYPDSVNPDDFTAIALYSQMKRTGMIESAHPLLNRLYTNTLWSQRANFIDIPTDCPQRDERMGWAGDAQVFAKTACYNYDVQTFFKKWLRDVCAEQFENGGIPDVIPNFWRMERSSTAWGDVITVIPWQVYLMYGDTQILADSFDGMKRWVDYITGDTLTPFLWTSSDEDKKLWGKHYGDWLALDAPYGSYKGSTNDDFIASAFYSYSCSLLIKAGKVLGKDMSSYETLYENIVSAFKQHFSILTTQTEHVLALYFHLTDHPDTVAANLVKLIRENGNRLQTGFVGTPYLLHVLSENGYHEVAYDLLLQEAYPSWLYEVTHGATTIWEHWDGIRDDGTLWSSDMNSYNHYAYGSVMDWVYTVAGGIRTDESAPGFGKVSIVPAPDSRLPWLKVSLKTKYGKIESNWFNEGNSIRYEIKTPVPATIKIGQKEYAVEKGSYIYYSSL